jgi:ppGpp synthetase/RelA/SpoT-type nucleotidyltranferase
MPTHRESSLTDFYNHNVFRWQRLQDVATSRVRRAVEEAGLQPHVISSRIKSLSSFVEKGVKPGPAGADYKYQDPERQITDLVGIRVVVAIADEIPALAAVVREELDVTEFVHRGNEDEGQPPGYQSLHLVARLRRDDPAVVEFPALDGEPCIEIQVRSILQDAYASFVHDLDYKAERPATPRTRRQLGVLASVLDLADREFARIRAEHVGDLDPTPEGAADAPLAVWTETSAAEAVRRFVGPGERDSASWLSALAEVLTALGFRDLTDLESMSAKLEGGAELAARLRLSRPWITGSQVLDALLQRALGSEYLDRRAPHLSSDDRRALTARLHQESDQASNGSASA